MKLHAVMTTVDLAGAEFIGPTSVFACRHRQGTGNSKILRNLALHRLANVLESV